MFIDDQKHNKQPSLRPTYFSLTVIMLRSVASKIEKCCPGVDLSRCLLSSVLAVRAIQNSISCHFDIAYGVIDLNSLCAEITCNVNISSLAAIAI